MESSALMRGAGAQPDRAQRRQVSIWDRWTASAEQRRAIRRLARPLGTRRWTRGRALLLVVVALVMAPVVLFAGGAIVGERLTFNGVYIVMIALLLSMIGVQLAMLLNPASRATRSHIVVRHLRVAPFRRAASGEGKLLLRLGRRRLAELRARLKPFSPFNDDDTARSLWMLGLLVMLLAMSASNLMRDAGERRFYQAVEALDQSSPTYDSDYRAAIGDDQRSRGIASRISFGGILAWVVLASAGTARSDFLRRRTLRRLDSQSCPDCGYGLRGAPAAVAPELLKGVPSGPVACPECGSPWPMIPPPTRDEVLTAAGWRTSGGRRAGRAAHDPPSLAL